MENQPASVYEAIGGERTMARIVDEFYARVEQHPLLRPLFPETFDDVRQRQFWFLSQLFGGPRLYTQHRGQPMLRMRHLPFKITEDHAKAWLGCMHEALIAAEVVRPAREAIFERLTMTAFHMVNQHGEE